MRLQTHRHARGIGADNAAAEHDDLRGRNARHAAKQHARARLAPSPGECAPAWIDMRPATSLIGANSGRPPKRSVTVS